MRARKGTRKQETQPGAAAITSYRFRISWVLLILLLLLALVAIALPGHARVTGREQHAAARQDIRFPLTDDSGESSSTAAATSRSQLVAGATASRVCFCHVGRRFEVHQRIKAAEQTQNRTDETDVNEDGESIYEKNHGKTIWHFSHFDSAHDAEPE